MQTQRQEFLFALPKLDGLDQGVRRIQRREAWYLVFYGHTAQLESVPIWIAALGWGINN